MTKLNIYKVSMIRCVESKGQLFRQTGYALALTLLLFLATLQNSVAQNQPVNFNFTLQQSATTSAGIYNRSGVLVKTLWNNVKYEAGQHKAWWDRTNDAGEMLLDTSYYVKVVSANVNYTWEGTIGNNSDSLTGSSKIRAFERFTSMAIAGQYAYYAVGYTEGVPSCYKFDINKPNQKINILFGDYNDIDHQADYVATDGTNVYWAGYDPYNASLSFVYATKTSNDKEFIFSNGSSQGVTYGRTYASVIDKYSNNANAHPSGLAVQKNGNYLFVAHKDLNIIRVFNKTSGALAQTLSFTAPREICVDGNDDLWVISGSNSVEKYPVNNDGTLGSVSLSITGLSEPLSLAVSPNSSKIVVLDGAESQQVKAFSNSTGNSVWTLGTAGGYINSPAVNNNKFYFNDSVTQLTKPFIAFQGDSSFWVGDVGNERVQHYSANRTFINRIMCLPHSYSVVADRNDPSKVFNEFLEFKVDYSKPLLPNNGSWVLKNNWRRSIKKEYYQHDKLRVFIQCITLSNNKTYAILDKYVDDIRVPEIVEFPSTGNLRYTGVTLGDFAQDVIGLDGSLRRLVTERNIGDSGYWEVQTLTGFSNGNPQWGSPSIVATLPRIKADDPTFSNVKSPVVTSGGYNIIFNAEKDNKGYHLGAIKNGTGEYIWKTSKATKTDYIGPLPTDGSFDIGNNVEYPGGNVYAVESNVFWNYHGEFWKNSQTNVWNHYHESGLMIGQFGISSLDGEATNKEAFAMGAGNVFSSTVLKYGNDYYIYHNDECNHGGVHRWKITGLNSVKIENINFQFNPSTSGGLTTVYYNGNDLNNMNVAHKDISATVNMVSPPTQISNFNNYSVKYTGFVKATHTQNYTFYTSGNKGMKLWVNGNLVINQWGNSSQNEFQSSPIKLNANKLYAIRLEISGGGIGLSWSGSNTSKQIIPSSCLYAIDESAMTKGTDLMEGIDASTILESGKYGWSRNSATEKYNAYDDFWNVKVNTKSYKKSSPDIQIGFRDYNNDHSVSRDLGTPASCINSWELTGKLNLERNVANWDNGGTFYFDVLDDQGKIISRIWHELTYISDDLKPTQIKINDSNAVNMNEKDLYCYLNKPQNFKIYYDINGLKFQFGSFGTVNANIYDNTAHWNRPKTIRFSFSGGEYDKFVGLQDLRFVTVTPTKPEISVQGKTIFCQGDSVVLTSSNSSAYLWSTNQTTQSITVKNSGTYFVSTQDASGCPSQSNSVVVNVNSLPVPKITPNGPIAFCQGDSVLLSCNSAKSYLWSNGKTVQSFYIKSAGNYSVKQTDANGCVGESSITSATVNSLPVVNVTAYGDLEFCPGKSVELGANGPGTWLWSNGKTTQKIVVTQTGNYFVKLTDNNGCQATSNSIAVKVTGFPIPTVSNSGASVFCEGDSVTLTSSVAKDYLWNTGAKTQSITVKTNGIYSVTASDGTGCSSISNPKMITVNEVPKPVITANENVLSSNYQYGNEWYKDGVLIPNATEQTLTVTETGKYSVMTYKNNCGGMSSEYEYVVKEEVGLAAIVNYPSMTLYPNPSQGKVNLKTNDQIEQIIVINAQGQVVLEILENTKVLNLDNLNSGVYFVRIKTDTGNYFSKLIKE